MLISARLDLYNASVIRLRYKRYSSWAERPEFRAEKTQSFRKNDISPQITLVLPNIPRIPTQTLAQIQARKFRMSKVLSGPGTPEGMATRAAIPSRPEPCSPGLRAQGELQLSPCNCLVGNWKGSSRPSSTCRCTQSKKRTELPQRKSFHLGFIAGEAASLPGRIVA